MAEQPSPNLDEYRVAVDVPSTDAPIVALVCDVCSQHSKSSGDVRWWEARDYAPSIAELIRDAKLHEKQGHRP